ncbi:MAG: hypothetical protein ACD_76C00162G0004 [uncultured bacterium]|nr:MAG: hypothetical protein ACD_76C00162G0004 [uncultured bacterium]HBD05387.1 hypothetical protein [Candidatus Uhrbacteria bacterium]
MGIIERIGGMFNEELSRSKQMHNQKQETDPLQIRLNNGIPLYHLFLDNPDSPVVSPDNAYSAREKLRQLAETNPDAISKLNGATREEAERIIQELRSVDRAA